MHFSNRHILVAAWVIWGGLAVSRPSLAVDFSACSTVEEAMSRLACYDRVAGRTTAISVPEPESTADIAETAWPEHAATSHLARRWAFDDESSDDKFKLRPYKPMYLMPATWTDRRNRMPASPAPDHALSGPVDIDSVEAKFQISLKTRLIKEIWNHNGDLWLGYTQSARWQVYNHGLSAPFRETNYEPEAMLVFRADQEVLGWRARVLGLSLNHQSNGRSLPLSRSWNRVIGELALERGDWVLSVRPWWRVPERASDDDNPDISDYVGRGELLLTHLRNGHQLTLQARHSLRTGKNSRGSARLDWAFPLAGRLKGHIQLFSGYGESLIDYNHRQTILGVGLSLADW